MYYKYYVTNNETTMTSSVKRSSSATSSTSPTSPTSQGPSTSRHVEQPFLLDQSLDHAKRSPDLEVFVQDLLDQMVRLERNELGQLHKVSHFFRFCLCVIVMFAQQSRFSEMGDSITGKMKDMGKRMDELEQSK